MLFLKRVLLSRPKVVRDSLPATIAIFAIEKKGREIMRSEEFSAKTIEEAVRKAAAHFGVGKELLTYEVLTAPSKGFLGIGSKPAVIKATVLEFDDPAPEAKTPAPATEAQEQAQAPRLETAAASEEASQPAPEAPQPAAPTEEDAGPVPGFDPVAVGQSFLRTIFEQMHLNTQIITEEKDGYLIFDIQGEDLGILIGRRGDTLDALQFLLNLVINRKGNCKIKAIIDIENYRAKREETLVSLSRKLAEKAKRTGQKVILEPMNPQERRIIHMTLQDDDAINTYSEGEEPYRKGIIVPKRKNNKRK